MNRWGRWILPALLAAIAFLAGLILPRVDPSPAGAGVPVPEGDPTAAFLAPDQPAKVRLPDSASAATACGLCPSSRSEPLPSTVPSDERGALRDSLFVQVIGRSPSATVGLGRSAVPCRIAAPASCAGSFILLAGMPEERLHGTCALVGGDLLLEGLAGTPSRLRLQPSGEGAESLSHHARKGLEELRVLLSALSSPAPGEVAPGADWVGFTVLESGPAAVFAQRSGHQVGMARFDDLTLRLDRGGRPLFLERVRCRPSSGGFAGWRVQFWFKDR